MKRVNYLSTIVKLRQDRELALLLSLCADFGLGYTDAFELVELLGGSDGNRIDGGHNLATWKSENKN